MVWLQLVAILVGKDRSTDAQPTQMKPVANGVTDDVLRVSETVHMGDLFAVVGRDRHLDDAKPGRLELEDDLGVEVEAVRVRLERDLPQRIRAVRPVPGVPLAELHTREGVLDPGEDAVAEILVSRHATAARSTWGEHPRPKHRVAHAVLERLDDLRQHLGCVLAVTVEENNDVDVVIDRPPATRFLVASIAQVLLVSHDSQGQVSLELLVPETDEIRGVITGVITDEYMVDPPAKVNGDAIEHLRQGRGRVVGDNDDADSLHDAMPPTPSDLSAARSNRSM